MKKTEDKNQYFAENIKIIDDVITNFVEWADEPTDDIQNAWVDIQESLRMYHDNAIKLKREYSQ